MQRERQTDLIVENSMFNRLMAAYAVAEKYNAERFCHKSKQGKGRAL